MAQLPQQPGVTAPLALYEQAAALAREHGFVVGSDEAYSEIYFGAEPPVSALQLGDLRGVAVFNTLSKRSSMPGYRSGFVAGDPELVALLKRYRPNVGVAPQAFVQRAAAAAWRDEAHVEAVRDAYRRKRDVLLPACAAAGLEHVGGDAPMFLWLRAPDGAAQRLLERGVVLAARGLRNAGGDATFFLWLDAGPQAELLADRLLGEGIVLVPGSYFGPSGTGYLRLALVPSLAGCERAAERLGHLLR